MGLFRKKRDIIDLRGTYRTPPVRKEIKPNLQDSQKENPPNPLGFFSAISNTISNQDSSFESSVNYPDEPNDAEEKRKKLSKRLIDMTDKIEELSNQIYHLQQRVELLERRLNADRFE